MRRAKVYVTDVLPQEARQVLEGTELFEGSASDETLAGAEVLLAWPSRARPEVLRKMKSLEMFQSMSAGVDAFDFAAIPKGAQVFSNAGAFTVPVAEHAWGMLLGAAKGIQLRNTRSTPRLLHGKTLLVVGCGAIGTEVAKLSRSLAMRTMGVSRSFREPDRFDERFPVESLGDAVRSADAVVISLPLTNLTRGLVGHDTLMKAKEDVVVANVGRGETVEEAGLVKWLKERPESRYTTDVFWKHGGREAFDTEAWDLPNFSGTLHVSGVPLGEGTSYPMVEAARNVRRFLETGRALNKVDVSEYQ
jgi:phosphoglycerate dehydrogenase-like enzyme